MMIKLFALVLAVMVITNQIVSAQITFSKDWRAGGKRSGQTLSTHGVSVVDVPCDQLAEYQTTKIKDLVRVSDHFPPN